MILCYIILHIMYVCIYIYIYMYILCYSSSYSSSSYYYYHTILGRSVGAADPWRSRRRHAWAPR